MTFDRQMIWHPFTQEQTAPAPIAITSGKGSYLYDEKGKAYLDLISSWWVNLHGHAHPEIAQKIYQQAQILEHVIFAGFTHEPAVTLCSCLRKVLPKSLKWFFFSDNGSTAVEVALKMAYQYWYNKGKKRRRLFLHFDGGYHGDTFGAMAVGKKSQFHDPFDPLLFETLTLPFPRTWNEDPTCTVKEEAALTALEEALKKNAAQICALIVEPLVQGAAGMRMCRPEFIKKATALAHRYDVLVIFDEVMTGFGRTGTVFACEQIGAEPDFICLSKGLTGGFLPLALTVTTQNIYDAFLDAHFSRAFAHGHSYTANPIACAAAIASFEILLRDTSQDSIAQIAQLHKTALEALRHRFRDKIKWTRCCGTIAAFDLVNPVSSYADLRMAFLEKGLLIRPLNSTIYLIPPYCITQKELSYAYEAISSVLEEKGHL